MNYILSQIFGSIALILTCISYFVKKKSTFLIFQIFVDIFYATSYILINVLGGGIITIFSIFRCILFYFLGDKHYKWSIYSLPLFFSIYITCGIVFWTGWLDIIPIFTSIMFTIAYVVKSLSLTRYIVLIPNFALCLFGILNANYSTALLDFIEFTVVIVAIITCHFRDKKEKLEKA